MIRKTKQKTSIIYLQQNGSWLKTRVEYDDKTKKVRHIPLRTTEFERKHGYSKEFAEKWGLI